MICNHKYELGQFLKKEDEDWGFSEAVDKEVDYLLSKDGDYYPWTIEHIEEAIDGADDFNSPEELISFVRKFWFVIAKKIAFGRVYGRRR